MPDFAKEVLSINLEDEMRSSYLDYAMSVIVGRALPDVRDGLKPVHRRVLYAMSELGNDWNKAYKKSARVVGDVIGKYHPHGDNAVYDTIVRMAQPFSMRYMLVDGQGNFGSVDGDPPAAMRYTEIRLAKIAHRLMADLAKDTVNFVPNYDEQETQPSVLPTRVPNLLTNGSSGIAVGMATNIPPHNMTEVISACIAMIDNPQIELMELMEHLPGPDFPTAGIINGARGILEAYRTGRGRIYLRALTETEIHPKTGRESIIVTELPYQVNKARLVEKISALVKEKRIEGISELRDESDKDGMRIVIDLKRGESSDVLLNNLYQHTQMQNVFGINMVALVDGQPKLLSLKEILEAFLRHRREVITRRTLFELRKARARAHILEGQMVALTNIDEVVALIKASPNAAAAKEALISRAWKPGAVVGMLERAGSGASRPEGLEAQFGLKEDGYWLSPVQVQAILDLRLHRLTGLEQDKIIAEYSQILSNIEDLLDILQDPDRLMQVIREELNAINDEFGDERRTEIVQTQEDLCMEDLIPEEDVVVTLSRSGYAKSQPLDSYRAQRRGGRGKSATSMKDEDVIDKLFVANTHDTILCFSSLGKLYWLRVFQIPQASRNSLGRPIVNLLPLEKDERINAFLPVREFDSDKFVFMATSNGTVKKTPLSDFSRPRTNGIIAIDLRIDDYLIDAAVTNGNHEIMLFTNAGKAIRFHERDVRSMGRTAYGVRGIRLGKEQDINALITFDAITSESKVAEVEAIEDTEAVAEIKKDDKQAHILVATENGYGKRTALDAFSRQKRGGMGVIAIQTSERNGMTIGATLVYECDQAMLISDNGTLVRTSINEISIQSRNTQGVTLIRLTKGEKLVEIERVENIDGDCGEVSEDLENTSDSDTDSLDTAQ